MDELINFFTNNIIFVIAIIFGIASQIGKYKKSQTEQNSEQKPQQKPVQKSATWQTERPNPHPAQTMMETYGREKSVNVGSEQRSRQVVIQNTTTVSEIPTVSYDVAYERFTPNPSTFQEEVPNYADSPRLLNLTEEPRGFEVDVNDLKYAFVMSEVLGLPRAKKRRVRF